MKESLANLQEVDPSAVQCRVDQDKLTSAVTGEPHSDRHYRLNDSRNFVVLLCISIGGEGEAGFIVKLIVWVTLVCQLHNKSYDERSKKTIVCNSPLVRHD